MAATIQDVAERAEVAVGTVFRYLNGAQLREKNRLKVEEAIDTLGFKENVLAIAVITGNLTDIFSTSIITVLERYVEKYRYNLLTCDFENDPKKLVKRLKFIKNRAIDGLVLVPSIITEESVKILQEYSAAHIPVVLVDDIIPGFEADAVLVDNAHASFRAVEHLIHANHREIAILNGRKEAYTTQERIRGSLEALHTYDIPIEEEWIRWGRFSTEGGYKALKDLFRLSHLPTAIYSTNYHSTFGAVLALNELQVRIPEDISFVGFDHFLELDLIKPPLTVIEQPLERIGRTVGEIMMKRIRGDYSDFPQKIELKTRMLIRDSVQKISSIKE